MKPKWSLGADWEIFKKVPNMIFLYFMTSFVLFG